MFDNYGGGQLLYNFKVEIASKAAVNPDQGDNPARQEQARLLALIESLKSQIAQLKAVLALRIGQTAAPANGYSCKAITADLYFGVENAIQVKCLQQVLVAQGSAIYPGAAVTGRFSTDTQAAVVRFQNKYASEILTPLGLKSGTGYVGLSTRNKINNLLAN